MGTGNLVYSRVQWVLRTFLTSFFGGGLIYLMPRPFVILTCSAYNDSLQSAAGPALVLGWIMETCLLTYCYKVSYKA